MPPESSPFCESDPKQNCPGNRPTCLEIEQRFRQFVEYVPIAVAMVDCQMRYLAVSRRWQQNWGVNDSDLIGLIHSQVFPSFSENSQVIYQQCLDTGSNAAYEEYLCKPNGEIEWVQWQIQPWFNSAGKIGGLILSIAPIEAIKPCQDIGEEIQVTRPAEFLHEFAMNQAADAIFWIKSDGHLSYVNEAACQLLGYTREELLQLTIEDIDPGFSPPIWSEHWLAIQECITFTFESTYHTSQGTNISVEIRVNHLAFNEEEYHCAFVRDITDRKQAAEALQDANEQLQAVLDAVPGLVSWVGSDLCYIGVNRHLADALKLPAESFIGQKIGFMEKRSNFYDLIEQFFAKSELTMSTEVKIPFESGDRSYLIVGQKYHQGQKAVFVGLDISDRQQMEMELRQSEEQTRKQAIQLEETLAELHRTQTQLVYTEKIFSLSQVVAGLAHEINNSISFIYGNIGYARQYFEDLIELIKIYDKKLPPYEDPDIQEFLVEIDFDFMTTDFPNILASMQLGADRIRQVVLSLRNFSRVDQPHKKPVNIHEGIDSTLLLLQNRLQAKAGRPGITVIKDYGNLPKIDCYAGQLNQVFINILNNAIDALEEHYRQHPNQRKKESSKIFIQTEVTEANIIELKETIELEESNLEPKTLNQTMAVIRIADNGPGIHDDLQEKLYDPGFTTKEQGQASGLGLTISRQIVVEKHGGSLTCNSQYGQGSEFVITIPLLSKKSSKFSGNS
jgi:two-component system NtrC family sensor kinase